MSGEPAALGVGRQPEGQCVDLAEEILDPNAGEAGLGQATQALTSAGTGARFGYRVRAGRLWTEEKGWVAMPRTLARCNPRELLPSSNRPDS